MQGRWIGQWEGHWFGHPNGEQPGDMAGATLFSVGADGTLSAIGAMSGTGAMSFGASGDLTGVSAPVDTHDCVSRVNPMWVALQGLYQVTPLALATQGLIAEFICEKRREDVHGSGKMRRPDGDRNRESRPRQDRRGEDLEDLVRSQWELLEARQRAQSEDQAARTVDATKASAPITRESGNQAADPAPAITRESGQAVADNDEDDLALILALLEAS